jgi:hypothetical protein
VVTHLTTNPPVHRLSTAEQTGSAIVDVLWSYVKDFEGRKQYIVNNQQLQNTIVSRMFTRAMCLFFVIVTSRSRSMGKGFFVLVPSKLYLEVVGRPREGSAWVLSKEIVEVFEADRLVAGGHVE